MCVCVFVRGYGEMAGIYIINNRNTVDGWETANEFHFVFQPNIANKRKRFLISSKNITWHFITTKKPEPCCTAVYEFSVWFWMKAPSGWLSRAVSASSQESPLSFWLRHPAFRGFARWQDFGSAWDSFWTSRSVSPLARTSPLGSWFFLWW